MIDIENDIFDHVSSKVEEQFPDANVQSYAVPAPPESLCVTVEEADNYNYTFTRDSKSNENHAVVMYEVEVSSNKTIGRKEECKMVFAFIDEIFLQMGFDRLSKDPASIKESTAYRIIGRYRAVVDKNKVIYEYGG